MGLELNHNILIDYIIYFIDYTPRKNILVPELDYQYVRKLCKDMGVKFGWNLNQGKDQRSILPFQ